jgi:acetoin utilization deacetylase AcuC-like enzyme
MSRSTEKTTMHMKKIKTCYREDYHAETPTQSMKKLKPVAQAVRSRDLATIMDGGNGDDVIPKLMKLHDPAYVEAFNKGEGVLASSQGWAWTPDIRQGVLAINQGMLTAARTALGDGIAANVAQGFHHARYESGEGFCTFNGIALVANENPDLKVAVLDCDEHSGNGTEDFIRRLPNLHQCTIYGSDLGCRGHERSRIFHLDVEVRLGFKPYLNALQRSFEHLRSWRPDLVIYQAGADPHENDPLGSLCMTADQMRLRDRLAFQFCRDEGYPVLFVLAGGYQKMGPLVELHVQTFEEATRVYGLEGLVDGHANT